VASLRTVAIVHELERSFGIGCERRGFRLVHYSFRGHHAHLIVEALDPHALGRGMKAIGARLARAVNRVTGHTGPVLADRYHARMLATPREVHRALRYVLLNARRHNAKGKETLGRALRIDRASSGRWFDGWKRKLPVTEREDGHAAVASPPVARARTWLLNVGWRRHGLLDPADVPG